ncbi:MAG: Hpt domain-containing protein [Nitrospirae bacterium]|nr:Hpt domain-containing protein [Nitrospirota bacterium]
MSEKLLKKQSEISKKKDTNEFPRDGDAGPAWLEGDKKLLKGIAAIFIKNVPVQIERLKEALDGNDVRQVEILSHSLKGSASMVGAQSLRDAAHAMESAAMDGDLEKARGFSSAIDLELKNVLASLRRIK